jgi:transposase
VQIRHLLDVLQRQSHQLDELRGTTGDLQEKLALLNAMAKEAQRDGAIPQEEAPATPKDRKKRQRFGTTPQPDLEREPRLFELDEPDRTCPSCGGELRPLDGQYEPSEMVDVVSVEYKLVEVQRQKYVCRCGGCVETAPGPDRAIDGGRYSLAFAIKVIVDKYLDHLPLSRQQRIMKRHGLSVLATTLWDQTLAIAKELTPTYEALKARILSSPVIGLDQTGWRRLSKRAKSRDKNRPWQMWCLTAPDAILHAICDDKSAVSFTALVGDYVGVIVCDAAATHEAGVNDAAARSGKRDAIKLAGCWAHVTRKFEDAEKDHPEALIVREMIRELYDVEDAKGDDDLGTRRQKQSKLILGRIETWLMSQAVLKTTSIGAAISYTLANWHRLKRFADNPRIPIDNNATERAIRGPVVGRKNHYGSKTERGTMVASIFYSLIETAKLVGVDPSEYLREAVLAARRGQVLLPHDFRTA